MTIYCLKWGPPTNQQTFETKLLLHDQQQSGQTDTQPSHHCDPGQSHETPTGEQQEISIISILRKKKITNKKNF